MNLCIVSCALCPGVRRGKRRLTRLTNDPAVRSVTLIGGLCMAPPSCESGCDVLLGLCMGTCALTGALVERDHTTFKLSGFQPFHCVPLSLTIYSV